VIEEQVADFERLGLEFEWKLYDHDQPSDLRDRLVAHGFAVEEGRGADDPRPGTDFGGAASAGDIRHPAHHRSRRVYEAVIAVHEEIWEEKQGWLAEELAQELRLGRRTHQLLCGLRG